MAKADVFDKNRLIMGRKFANISKILGQIEDTKNWLFKELKESTSFFLSC
jgi:hypothetical protein